MAVLTQTRSGVLLFAVFASFSLATSAATSKTNPTVTWQPQTLVNGSPVLFEIHTKARVRTVTATWMRHQLAFFAGKSGAWYALAGIPVETPRGAYQLKIVQTLANGKCSRTTRLVRVRQGKYRKIAIKVAKRFTEPDPQQLKEALADKELKQQLFAATTPERLWLGSFVPPVGTATSDGFGTARVFNGEVTSRHQGLDFAAPPGTEVRAVNQGSVILARPMYFEGNFVVIDHGQGLYSLYLHLSAFRVKEGENVKSGQVIGLSGGSGRASGPHLHLAIRWQGVYLDPATLLKIKLPMEQTTVSGSARDVSF